MTMMIGWFITVAVFMLNLWALLRVNSSPLLSRSQKFFQTLFVFFVPILGAVVVLMMSRFPKAAEPNRDAVNGFLGGTNQP